MPTTPLYDCLFTLHLDYTVIFRGFPPTGPSWNDPGEPGAPPEFTLDNISIEVDGKVYPLPEELVDAIYKDWEGAISDCILEDISFGEEYGV